MNINKYISQIVLPKEASRKGENGRVIVIGGSELFHAAPFWAASMASRIVDMVHFSSPTLLNNELLSKRAKENFWDGIVVPWEDKDKYIEEDDCILIGPGMERGEETREIVNKLLKQYPDKKWVVDGGALQEVDPRLLNENMIITPNLREQEILKDKISVGVTVLAKGAVDVITGNEKTKASENQITKIEIAGGSPAMTKGGTGDVLAGIVAGLYAKSPAMASCVVASRANKLAGEELEQKMGVFYGATDLIPQVQIELGKML